jgi:hypothetical protein
MLCVFVSGGNGMGANRRTAKSLAGAIAAALAIFGLTACGQAFDKSFNAAFDKKTHDSCVTSATQRGAAADVAEKYCTCVVTELDKLSVPDKMSLQAHQEKLQPAMDACRPK